MLLPLSFIQRCKKAMFVREDLVEIEKDFIAKLLLLVEIDNRRMGSKEWSEENLLITPNVIRGCKNTGGGGTHVLQCLQIGDILLLTLNNLKDYALALNLLLRQ